MARKPILLLVSVLLSLSAFTQQTWRAGEVLVLLNQEARIDDVQNELSRVLPDGITVKEMKQLGILSPYHKLVLEGARMEERAIANLVASAHGIRGVSLNYLVQYRAVPNDTEYISQWAMDDILSLIHI